LLVKVWVFRVGVRTILPPVATILERGGITIELSVFERLMFPALDTRKLLEVFEMVIAPELNSRASSSRRKLLLALEIRQKLDEISCAPAVPNPSDNLFVAAVLLIVTDGPNIFI
jgi:hypothetical protein